MQNVVTAPEKLFHTQSGAALDRRVHLTLKEVHYVQQTAQSVAEFLLRRIMSSELSNRDGGTIAAPVAPVQESLKTMGLLPIHQGLVLHAAHLQLDAFSGGALEDSGLLRPRWLSLMLEGKGLRRMTPDTFRYATRLVDLVGMGSLEAVSRHWITDPWKAYRLGMFRLALEILDRGDHGQSVERAAELRLRVRLASQPLDEEMSTQITALARDHRNLRMSLLSSAIAYATKQGQAVPADLVRELEAWLISTRASDLSSADALLFAQVLNAINLVYMHQGKMDPILAGMSFLLESVTPKIADPSRRAHVEGNAYFQSSILARRRSDKSAELDALLSAMELDTGFSTLYYRMAQLFHDQGDERATPFYEMALALSPLDLPTANDYGCYLADSGQQAKFDSWAMLCRALFPEQFAAEGAPS